MLGPLLLFLTVFIWGTAFLAQKSGADYLGPFAITALRSVLGSLFLAACLGVRQMYARTRSAAASAAADAGQSPAGLRPTREGRALSRPRPTRRSALPGRSVFAGVACGVPLFAAMCAQQIGIETITPGVSAFLTANYVLLVPLGAAVVLRRRVACSVWVGVALALVGSWFVSMGGESLTLGKGEAWTLLCAALFAVQMLTVDHFAKNCDVLAMSLFQLVTCAVLGFACLAFSAEGARLTFGAVKAAGWALFYVGILSSGVAYTLQNFGQARTSPALAAIICSLEGGVSAFAGWLWRGDILTGRQALGCSLVFAAILIASLAPFLPQMRDFKNKRKDHIA